MELSGFGTLLLVFVLSFLVTMWVRRKGQQPKFPPGPTPLPLLGNILQIDFKNIVEEFVQLGLKYGPVSMAYLGPKKMVILNGYDVVREAFQEQGEVFSDRPRLAIPEMVFKDHGLIFTNGERWKQMRRFTLSTLRNFGMGKRSLEERVQQEAQCLGQELQKRSGTFFDPTFLFSLAVSNVICSIVFEDRYDYEDMDFLDMLALMKETFQMITSPWAQMFDLAPNLLKRLPGPQNKLFKNFDKLRKYVMEKIKAHEETLDENCPRDYIDCFLIRMNQEKDNQITEFNYENLIANLIHLFLAGTETTSTSLRYSIIILLKYPNIAKKMQEEIDHITGNNRCPSVEDRIKMPLTDAVIHEIQRFADITPLGVPRATSQDTVFRGYHIPKGVTVFPMITSVLKDSTYFKDPEVFDPAHFLNEQSNLKKTEAFIPFSIGKRACPGEGLARMEIFLFLTYLLQKFNLKCDKDPEDIDLSPIPNSGAFAPRPYQISVTLR
ncbi:cytochrome P450 2C42-like isoform X1 [Bufo gargarizans]|uniref:cytochrome P450 2C42-like isoform X1 n=1 Tax=Bufo gargarizans TaxID=30331 RepID=UPI001CF52EBB|nr:cytochrome P450 2C42-like isoform X1 [Bufo gargarizans]